jgi:hypothetical protein
VRLLLNRRVDGALECKIVREGRIAHVRKNLTERKEDGVEWGKGGGIPRSLA